MAAPESVCSRAGFVMILGKRTRMNENASLCENTVARSISPQVSTLCMHCAATPRFFCENLSSFFVFHATTNGWRVGRQYVYGLPLWGRCSLTNNLKNSLWYLKFSRAHTSTLVVPSRLHCDKLLARSTFYAARVKMRLVMQCWVRSTFMLQCTSCEGYLDGKGMQSSAIYNWDSKDEFSN